MEAYRNQDLGTMRSGPRPRTARAETLAQNTANNLNDFVNVLFAYSILFFIVLKYSKMVNVGFQTDCNSF